MNSHLSFLLPSPGGRKSRHERRWDDSVSHSLFESAREIIDMPLSEALSLSETF